MTTSSARSLEDKLKDWKNPVEMLRNSLVGPYVFPIASEFSNWRDEQAAWQKSAVLFDLSNHMTDILFEGPDLMRLLSDLAVNSFATFGKNKAKQIVCCNEDGFVIGDGILFGLDENLVNISGRPSIPNWVAFNAETGDYDVKVSRDERSVANKGRRRNFRFQVLRPNSEEILRRVVGGTLPDIKFFNIGQVTIAGIQLNALNHGMSRTGGLEIWGPTEHSETVRNAIKEAGADLGLTEVGARAYSTVSPESGWIPSPMPAIYTGESMRPYREWLPADGFEANASLGGSYYSDNIEDYYQTPWDLGYGRHVKFDHDFLGREALEQLENQPHKKKVWLVWDDDDVTRIYRSMFGTGTPFKYLELPGAQYSTLPFDKVLQEGEMIGLSTYNVYTVNVGHWFSLAMVDEETAVDGAKATLIWGEEDGGSAKPIVERHEQTEVRVTIRTSRPVPSETD
jgi:glycine cleavage system aminomethyltransferase T